METKESLLQKRDAKTTPHLQQYAPVWIMDDTIVKEENAVLFRVIFRHNTYGWVSRRYRYDGGNDILYHKGQTLIDEEAVSRIENRDPYVLTAIANTPNAYGG